MSLKSNEAVIPVGTVSAGNPGVRYFDFRPTRVTKSNVKGVPGMDLTVKATVSSPRTSRAIRRAVNGAFGKEKILKSENRL